MYAEQKTIKTVTVEVEDSKRYADDETAISCPLRPSTHQHTAPTSTHRPQKVILLDPRPPLIPHRARQLPPRLIRLDIPPDTAPLIAARQVDRLLIHRHLRRQRLRVQQLLLPQRLRRRPPLLLRLGEQIALVHAARAAFAVALARRLVREDRPEPGRVFVVCQSHGVLFAFQKVEAAEDGAGRHGAHDDRRGVFLGRAGLGFG